jgi:hypothetical protein
MKTTHTPGKWNLEENNGIIYLMDEQDKAIATIHTREDGINNNARIKEGKANAKLIAAAPELLEILQGFIEARDAGYRKFKEERYTRARAAIKKATE